MVVEADSLLETRPALLREVSFTSPLAGKARVEADEDSERAELGCRRLVNGFCC